jgi:succinate-semialdehyde dehydrogenase/glutarate-semialdehyde dehydrogenase
MGFEERLKKIFMLAQSLEEHRGKIIEAAARDLCFTVKDTDREVSMAIDRLHMLEQARGMLEHRRPLGGPGSQVALMLSYNGTAWLNAAICSIYLVGNRLAVKFSSKAPNVMALTEEMYRPIFGEEIQFYRGPGGAFLEQALASPDVQAVVVFGFDANILPYEGPFRERRKKLVFEGPGQDPFIVFADADLEMALDDLVDSKFNYSGQTCTAPKRIFIECRVYAEFLEKFVGRVDQLVVGNPNDPRTDVSPVASALAIARIREQLAEAREKGARVLTGGRIEGSLIYPTVIENATDDMLGMREEVFGPVAFTTSFETPEEVLERARRHRYGLRAAVFGGEQAREVAATLRGEAYCHPVDDYTFGRFGTLALNEPRRASWRGALIVKAVGGYGYSGWIWETVEGRFQLKQGPKLLSLETSIPA